jgi:hypothetical protein
VLQARRGGVRDMLLLLRCISCLLLRPRLPSLCGPISVVVVVVVAEL